MEIVVVVEVVEVVALVESLVYYLLYLAAKVIALGYSLFVTNNKICSGILRGRIIANESENATKS